MDNILISVCIPIYNGEQYIEELLERIYGQTYKNIEVLISIDQSIDKTLEICQKFQQNNTKIFIQNNRLGWVNNCNFLIKHTTGQYFSIIPHDDLIPYNYFEILLKGFDEHPQAVNCYPYIQAIGNHSYSIIQPSIKGDIQNRIFDSIDNHINGVSFRGLVKRNIPDHLLYLCTDQPNNIMADSIWILQHAIAGELYSINVSYHKRYHPNNEHSKWINKPLDFKINTWIKHCSTLYQIAEPYLHNTDKKLLYEKCVDRLLYNKHNFNYIPKNHLNSTVLNKFNNAINTKHVGILGAGIQGCCVALLFKKLGYDVSLIDQMNDIMEMASKNQEGKIHLGFVYSNDQTFQTGEKMMLSALNFSCVLEYLLDEKIDWKKLKSNKFMYLIPHDSLVPIEKIIEYFDQLQNLYTKMIKENPFLSYIGEQPDKIFYQIPVPDNVDNEFFKYAFQTEEIAISQPLLKNIIKKSLITKNINLILNEYIIDIKKNLNNKYDIQTDKGYFQFDKIVNCLWSGQQEIDQRLGLNLKNENNLRLKFGITSNYITELENMPSITIVNGPYGDYVNFPYKDDRRMYFSWYPYSMYGMIVNETIPTEWNDICKDNIDVKLKEEQLNKHNEKFKELFKREFAFIDPKLIGGIIVAIGKDDINHLDSKLHQRNDKSVFHDDGYYSISTCKFTSAPYNTWLLKKYL